MKLMIGTFLAALLHSGLAPAQTSRAADVKSSRSFVYHGKLVRPDGSNPTGSLSVTLKILSPDPKLCLLWAESQIADVKEGGFSLELGHAVHRLPGASGGIAADFKQAFINNPSLVHAGAQCASGNSYAPGTSDDRLMTATFNDSGNVIEVAGLPIKSVPFALQAEEIGGYGLGNLMKISDGGSGVTFTPAETQSLKDLLGADLVWDLKSRKLTKVATPTAGDDATTKAYVDAAISTAVAGAGAGSVTSVTVAGGALSVTPSSTSPMITLNVANASQPGYLSAADWSTFNGKQPAGAYLTSITSGNVTTALGFTPLSAAVTAGQVYVGTGASSAAQFLRIGDIRANVTGNPSFLGASGSCAAGQSLQYISANDRLECAAYALAANAVATASVNDKAITYAKLQDLSTNNRLLGRSTAGAGVAEEITVGSGLSLSAGTLTAPAPTTVGTITSGTWNGSIIPVGYGGTGTATGSITAPASTDLTFASGSGNTYVRLNPSGTGAVLIGGKAGIGTTNPSADLEVYRTQASLTGTSDTAVLIHANSMDNLGGGTPTLLKLNAPFGGTPTGSMFVAQNTSNTFELKNSLTDFARINFGTYASAVGGVNPKSLLGVSFVGSNFDGYTPLLGVPVNIDVTSWGGGTMSYRNVYGVPVKIRGTNNSSYAFYADVSGSTDNWAFYAANGNSHFGGNVGIGTVSPSAKLTVQGAAINAGSISNATATIDFLTGNLQHTAANCGAMNLHNLKDGGSYMMAVKGTTSATCSFTAYSDAGTTGITVHMPTDHGATINGKHTIYNFVVMGGDVYVSWSPGL